MFDWAKARGVAAQFAKGFFPSLDPEDVAQDVMVSLLTGRSSGNLAIRPVVQRRGADILRKETGRGEHRKYIELDVALRDPAPQPDHVLHMWDLIDAALRTTDVRNGRAPSPQAAQRYRRLVTRVYINGEKPGEVAKEEGISASELSRIVSAAKKRRTHAD